MSSSKEMAILNSKLPAHLKALASTGTKDEWVSGTQSGFPVISIDGKVFHVKRGDQLELVTRPDDPEEAATSLYLVVLRSNRGIARTFYKKKFVTGSDDPPDCYSNDGVTPELDSPDKQAKKCATCPQAAWGSRITENGKKGKACSEVKRLAVVASGMLNDPMLLRLPPTSLKVWDEYVDMLDKRGINPTQVITRVSFDSSVSHQQFKFRVAGFVTDEMVPEIAETLQNSLLEQIIGAANTGAPADAEEEEEEDDDDAPAPKSKTPPAKSRAKPKPAPVDDDDEEDEEYVPPPAKKAAGKKAAPKPPVDDDDDDDEEVPPPKKAKAKKAVAPPPQDDDDDDDEEDAPAPATKRKPAAKKSARSAAPAAAVEDDDEGLDGLEGLDFSDLDFGNDDED